VRLGALNILLCWVLFVALFLLIATGAMLYFGIAAGGGTNRLHWIATWSLPAFVVCHVLAHYRIGGWAQLLRVVRPTGLTPPPPKLDAGELLTLLVERSSEPAPNDGPRAPSVAHDGSHREPLPTARPRSPGRNSV